MKTFAIRNLPKCIYFQPAEMLKLLASVTLILFSKSMALGRYKNVHNLIY